MSFSFLTLNNQNIIYTRHSTRVIIGVSYSFTRIQRLPRFRDLKSNWLRNAYFVFFFCVRYWITRFIAEETQRLIPVDDISKNAIPNETNGRAHAHRYKVSVYVCIATSSFRFACLQKKKVLNRL